MGVNKFIAAAGQCDIFLDSIGWSGCNSALESLPNNLPIVTLRGALMRGQHSAAILAIMDMPETIAGNVDEFVAIAARLAGDPQERGRLKEQTAANKHRLYRDRACITALEDFLEASVRPA
jgi:protein O-GlcNAc transferase